MANNDFAFFYNSENHDRVYDADSFSTWLKKFFNTGVFSGELKVEAKGGMDVLVGSGYCNIEGKVRFFDDSTTFTIAPASSSYARIDTIVAERNDTERNITLKYVQGDYSGTNPQPKPPVRTASIYQLVLAQITVPVGATAITSSNILDTRGQSDICGLVTTVAVAGNDSVINIERNGLVFTATRTDGESFTFDQQDTITRVKGNAESTYRLGDVNITPANVGAVNKVGDTMTGNLKMSSNVGVYGKDSTNHEYPLIIDNMTNIWIGAQQTQSTHHTGKTYISSGYDGTKGNATIFVSVPNESNTNATNYAVYHSGNKPTKADVGLGKVENKSSADILGGLTKKNVTDALGYTPPTTNTTYSKATASADGLMSKEDKTKLDGITAKAALTGVKGNAESSYRTGNVNLTPANIGALALTGGTLSDTLIISSASSKDYIMKSTTVNLKNGVNGVTNTASSQYCVKDKNDYNYGGVIVSAQTDGKVFSELRCRNYDTSGTAQAQQYFGIRQDKSGNVEYLVSSPSKLTEKLTAVSTSANGLMSAADKTKLDGIASGATKTPEIKTAFGSHNCGNFTADELKSVTITTGKPSGTILACIPVGCSPQVQVQGVVGDSLANNKSGKFYVKARSAVNNASVHVIWIYY